MSNKNIQILKNKKVKHNQKVLKELMDLKVLKKIKDIIIIKNILLIITFIFSASCFASSDLNINTTSHHPLSEKSKHKTYHCQAGDILFQSLPCGSFCDAIDSVTYGLDNARIDHVGMVVSCRPKAYVAEAVSVGVVKTPLNKFLNKSHDRFGQPRVWVGRVKSKYKELIPGAIKFINIQYGKPYNASFVDSKKSFYCSQLIVDAYAAASSSKQAAPFSNKPMNFKNLNTHHFVPKWVSYYKDMHMHVPQGRLGSNPAGLSRSNSLRIVSRLGQMPRQKRSS